MHSWPCTYSTAPGGSRHHGSRKIPSQLLLDKPIPTRIAVLSLPSRPRSSRHGAAYVKPPASSPGIQPWHPASAACGHPGRPLAVVVLGLPGGPLLHHCMCPRARSDACPPSPSPRSWEGLAKTMQWQQQWAIVLVGRKCNHVSSAGLAPQAGACQQYNQSPWKSIQEPRLSGVNSLTSTLRST